MLLKKKKIIIHYRSSLPLNESNLVSYLTSLPQCQGWPNYSRQFWSILAAVRQPYLDAPRLCFNQSYSQVCSAGLRLASGVFTEVNIVQDPVPVTKWPDLFNWGRSRSEVDGKMLILILILIMAFSRLLILNN